MSKYVIYVLGNRSFPNFVKIGVSSDINKTLKHFNKPGYTPFSYICLALYELDARMSNEELYDWINRLLPEAKFINGFDGKTYTREFYYMADNVAVNLVRQIAYRMGHIERFWEMGKEQPKTMQISQSTGGSKRRQFSLALVQVPIGAWIQYVGPNATEQTVAQVVDGRCVSYNGRAYTLKDLARLFAQTDDIGPGPRYFAYNGENLVDRRERMRV